MYNYLNLLFTRFCPLDYRRHDLQLPRLVPFLGTPVPCTVNRDYRTVGIRVHSKFLYGLKKNRILNSREKNTVRRHDRI